MLWKVSRVNIRGGKGRVGTKSPMGDKEESVVRATWELRKVCSL